MKPVSRKVKSASRHSARKLSMAKLRALPKILLHEHIDCSPRVRTMLEMWEKRGFDKAKFPLPQKVLDLWVSNPTRGRKVSSDKLRANRMKACQVYQAWLKQFASSSLANYVKAIVDHILPLMQTEQALYRITQERIKDAVKDGIIAMELRFAPQLHTWEGLTHDQVMKSVIRAVKESPIPVKLTLCALRHEDGKMGRIIGDLTIKYEKYVGSFDLAADEHANPGVLDWWLKEAVRARSLRSKKYPLVLQCHLGETDAPTAADLEKLKKNNINVVGHGIRDMESDYVRLVCPTSNVVLGQVASLSVHPIDALHRTGKPVTLDTDGLTLTGLSGLTEEYSNMQEAFGWYAFNFLTVNETALKASSFSPTQKKKLQRTLRNGYYDILKNVHHELVIAIDHMV